MTEKELNQLGLLEEFSITELEQRLEFEAWCDSCTDDCPNTTVNRMPLVHRLIIAAVVAEVAAAIPAG